MVKTVNYGTKKKKKKFPVESEILAALLFLANKNRITAQTSQLAG
jgi:hypothetical protein